ncbi:TPA: hypothetical protein N0F65_005781, partial [Lagenidium giganteum]
EYRNKTIEEVYDIDVQYARWLQNQDILIGPEPESNNSLKKFKDRDSSYLMTWGRYMNHTIKWIHTNNKAYFQWLQKMIMLQRIVQS